MLRSDRLEELLDNFASVVPDVLAVVVSDHDGLVLASTGAPGLDENVLGVVSTQVKPVLSRLREEFAYGNFGTATLESENFRMIVVDTGKGATVAIALEPAGSIDATYPFAYLLAEKTALLLEGSQSVETTIPPVGVPPDDRARLRDILYQTHLHGGTYKYKFVILGEAGVGKTSIVVRFVENRFQTDYRATIGLNVLTHGHKLVAGDEMTVNFSIWDVGSQAYFKRVRTTYYVGANAAFVVFDLTDRASFEAVPRWVEEMEKFAGRQVVYVVIGNKLDLEDQRAVSREEAVELAVRLGASYMETSAKTGSHVEDAFTLLAYKLIEAETNREERTMAEQIGRDLAALVAAGGPLKIGVASEDPLWNPFVTFFLTCGTLGGVKRDEETPLGREIEFDGGVTVKVVTFDGNGPRKEKVEYLADCRGVLLLFQERFSDRASAWKELIVELVESAKPKAVVGVAVKTRESSTWVEISEKLVINDALESNPESVAFFFRLSADYRFELLDNLKAFVDALER
ncbi:MAG: hypothetical protein Kow0069_31110 [Promethearchaeota archaeon]